MKTPQRAYAVVPKKADGIEWNWHGLEVFPSRAAALREKEESDKVYPILLVNPRTHKVVEIKKRK